MNVIARVIHKDPKHPERARKVELVVEFLEGDSIPGG